VYITDESSLDYSSIVSQATSAGTCFKGYHEPDAVQVSLSGRFLYAVNPASGGNGMYLRYVGFPSHLAPAPPSPPCSPTRPTGTKLLAEAADYDSSCGGCAPINPGESADGLFVDDNRGVWYDNSAFTPVKVDMGSTQRFAGYLTIRYHLYNNPSTVGNTNNGVCVYITDESSLDYSSIVSQATSAGTCFKGHHEPDAVQVSLSGRFLYAVNPASGGNGMYLRYVGASCDD